MEPYWSRYPMMLQIDAKRSSDAETAAKTAEFCAENKGGRLEWDTIRECCRDFVAEDVAEHFAQCLDNIR